MSRTTGASSKEAMKTGTVFRCDLCDKNFPFKLVLDMHKRDHNFKDHYKCNVCQAAYPKKSQLKMHYRKHTGERPFKCNECPADFMNSSNLHRHERKHTRKRRFGRGEWEHNNTDTLCGKRKSKGRSSTTECFSCDICNEMFANFNLLMYHKNKKKCGKQDIVCDVPGPSFKINEVTDNLLPIKNICNSCGTSFTSKDLLVNHQCKFSQKFTGLSEVSSVHPTGYGGISYREDYPSNSSLMTQQHLQSEYEALHLFQNLHTAQPTMVNLNQPLHDNQYHELHPSHLYLSSIQSIHNVTDSSSIDQFNQNEFISNLDHDHSASLPYTCQVPAISQQATNPFYGNIPNQVQVPNSELCQNDVNIQFDDISIENNKSHMVNDDLKNISNTSIAQINYTDSDSTNNALHKIKVKTSSKLSVVSFKDIKEEPT